MEMDLAYDDLLGPTSPACIAANTNVQWSFQQVAIGRHGERD